MTDQYEPAPFEPPPRSSSRPPWLVPAGIVGLLAVIVVVGLVLFTRDDDSGGTASDSSTPQSSDIVDTSAAGAPQSTSAAASVPPTTVAPSPASTEPPPPESSVAEPATTQSAVEPVVCPGYDDRDTLPLSLCDSGTFVSEAQVGLVNWGAQIEADGYFGPATEAAVRDFQTASALEPDGIIGENTWAVLCPFTNNLCEPD